MTTSDDLFFPSEVEVFGYTKYSFAGEGTQYDYYKAGNSKVKNLSGSASWWWDRSPYSNDSARFCAVISSGDSAWGSASTSGGVPFSFCF